MILIAPFFLDFPSGAVPTQLVARIQQLTVPQLEELGEVLLDFANIAELETWLDR
jgi:hypothetical protein